MSPSVPTSPSPLKSALEMQGRGGQFPERQAKKALMSESVPMSPSQLKSAEPQRGAQLVGQEPPAVQVPPGGAIARGGRAGVAGAATAVSWGTGCRGGVVGEHLGDVAGAKGGPADAVGDGAVSILDADGAVVAVRADPGALAGVAAARGRDGPVTELDVVGAFVEDHLEVLAGQRVGAASGVLGDVEPLDDHEAVRRRAGGLVEDVALAVGVPVSLVFKSSHSG